ncbi:hypothetical protein KQI63_13165 [bacterium]|nr:hypothetical protein [bacterium]
MKTFSAILLLSFLLTSIFFSSGCEVETERQRLNVIASRTIESLQENVADSIRVTIEEYVEHETLKTDVTEPGNTSDYVYNGFVTYDGLELTPPNPGSDEWTLVSDEPLFFAGQPGSITTDTPDRPSITYSFTHPTWIDSLDALPDSVARGDEIEYAIRSSDPVTILLILDELETELFEGRGRVAGQSIIFRVPESFHGDMLILLLQCTGSLAVNHRDESMGMTYNLTIRDTVRVVDPE